MVPVDSALQLTLALITEVLMLVSPLMYRHLDANSPPPPPNGHTPPPLSQNKLHKTRSANYQFVTRDSQSHKLRIRCSFEGNEGSKKVWY